MEEWGFVDEREGRGFREMLGRYEKSQLMRVRVTRRSERSQKGRAKNPEQSSSYWHRFGTHDLINSSNLSRVLRSEA